jgi:hypothetical protein
MSGEPPDGGIPSGPRLERAQSLIRLIFLDYPLASGCLSLNRPDPPAGDFMRG